ncbi:unnamed protein product, partial [Taenia asiatica]|uniref:PAP-associated domain-containing protein n=1 Tax=Taenia asiatica TaxID=60517 RepID=A0A0R3VXF1_TAEAS
MRPTTEGHLRSINFLVRSRLPVASTQCARKALDAFGAHPWCQSWQAQRICPASDGHSVPAVRMLASRSTEPAGTISKKVNFEIRLLWDEMHKNFIRAMQINLVIVATFPGRSDGDATTGYFDDLLARMERFFKEHRQTIVRDENKVGLRNSLPSTTGMLSPNPCVSRSDFHVCLYLLSTPKPRCQFIDWFAESSNYRRIRCFLILPPGGIECGLNANNAVDIRSTHLLAVYTRVDPRLSPLGVFVKQWAQRMDIHGGNCGELRTYALLLMVIQYLQCGCSPPVLPNLQARFPLQDILHGWRPVKKLDVEIRLLWDEMHSAQRSTVGDLFVDFITYYASFEFDQWVISVRRGRFHPTREATSKIIVEGFAKPIHSVSGELMLCLESVVMQRQREFDCRRPVEQLDVNLQLPWKQLLSANRSTVGELFAGFVKYYANF